MTHGDGYSITGGALLGAVSFLNAKVAGLVEPVLLVHFPPFIVNTMGAMYYGAIGGVVGWAVKKAMDHLSEVYKKRKIKNQ